jgi:hypothetical protein
MPHSGPSEWWVIAAGIGAAAGTFVLALAAFWQLRAARRQADAATRPVVVPAPSGEWTRQEGAYAEDRWASCLPLKNVGPGVALNVTGQLTFTTNPENRNPTEHAVSLLHANLESGGAEDLVIGWVRAVNNYNWSLAGKLYYSDINGDRWCTAFVSSIEERRKRIRLTVESVGRIDPSTNDWLSRQPKLVFPS